MKRLLPLLLAILLLLPGCSSRTEDGQLAVSEAAAPDEGDTVVVVTDATAAPTALPMQPDTQPPIGTPFSTGVPAGTPHEDSIALLTPERTAVPTPAPTPPSTPTPVPEPFIGQALPDTVRVRRGFTETGSPGVLRRDSDGSFYAYGSVGGTEPCFYPCDETGAVAPGEHPTDVVCAVPSYTPADASNRDGEKLLVVYLGSQCVVGYEGEDGDWKELRVMICSTGRRKHETPVGVYKITDRYTYKLLGTEESYCYGLWACRFKDHYLFHSVPIGYDAGRDSEMGHRMCNMHKYEKLGSVASDGCVRLTVADAKWIYELSESERVNVRVVKENGPTPVKPPDVIWEEPYTDRNGYGWDPTDPHPLNPYHNLQP